MSKPSLSGEREDGRKDVSGKLALRTESVAKPLTILLYKLSRNRIAMPDHPPITIVKSAFCAWGPS
eukprot:756811-Hanusia_phi.AAC.9